jgi:uncharacterized protein (DUF58 family)
MRLTGRGKWTFALLAIVIVFGYWHSPRSLNAIAAPAMLASVLAAGVVWYGRVTDVAVSDIRTGDPGEERTLRIDVAGRGFAHVEIDLSDGLEPARIESAVTLPHEFDLSVTLANRGDWDVGATTIRIQDPLGLVESRVETEAARELLVFPERYAFDRDVTAESFVVEFEAERQEFEYLRPAQPADPVRYIDWKASAKRPETYAMEFSPTPRRETLVIAGAATWDQTDEMAAAIRTVAELALDAGLDVAVSVPDATIKRGSGSAHLERICRILARTGPGPLPAEAPDADVVVDGGDRRIRKGPSETTIEFGDESTTLAELRQSTGSAATESRATTAEVSP